MPVDVMGLAVIAGDSWSKVLGSFDSARSHFQSDSREMPGRPGFASSRLEAEKPCVAGVTLHSIRGLAVLVFQHSPLFNYKVIALKTRKFVLKARTMFATKFVLDLNAKW